MAPVSEVAATTGLAGSVIVGGTVLNTLTVKLAMATLPEASVAVTLTVVVPAGKVPEACEYLITGLGSATSNAVACGSVTAAPPPCRVAWTTRFGGTTSTGGVVSLTVRVNDPCWRSPRRRLP